MDLVAIAIGAAIGLRSSSAVVVVIYGKRENELPRVEVVLQLLPTRPTLNSRSGGE